MSIQPRGFFARGKHLGSHHALHPGLGRGYMQHNSLGLPFWTVSFIFVAIWMTLDLVHKDKNVTGYFVISVQTIAISIALIFFVIQFLHWARTI
jgi:hypothetical protein